MTFLPFLGMSQTSIAFPVLEYRLAKKHVFPLNDVRIVLLDRYLSEIHTLV